MAKQVTLYPGSPDMIKLGPDLWEFGKGAVTRRFSWREAAAIQTFPKDLEFCGDLTSKYKQIGNAVPVKLAEYVATQLYAVLNIKEVSKKWPTESKQPMEKHSNTLVLKPSTKHLKTAEM
jgi:DNA (cytosine-5)-methyltransferase 1